MAKATSYKAGSKSTLVRGRDIGLYDHTLINKWEEESKESSKFLDEYITRRKNQEWMSEDEVKNYRSALERYKSSTDSLANLRRSFGNYSEEDDKKWSDYFSNLSSDIDSATKLYSRYKSADSFNAYLQAVKETEELGGLDLDALKAEIDSHQSQLDSRKNDATRNSNIDNLRNQINELEKEISGTSQYIATFNPDARAELDEKKKRLSAWKQMLKKVEDEDKASLSTITELTAKYNRAKEIQDTNRVLGMLEGVTDPTSANYDPEYDAYVQKGASIENPSYDDSLPKMNIFGWKPYGDGETVNNPVTFTQENEEEFNNADRPDPNLDLLVTEMTEEQIDHYNYLISKHGRETADVYLEAVRDKIRSDNADEFFETHLEDKELAEIMYSLAQGFDQFSTGMETLGGGNYSDKRLLDPQMIGARAREDLYDDSIPVWYNFKTGEWEDKILGSSVAQTLYDLGTTGANMAPSMAVGALSNLILPGSGAVVGTGLMGASAGGNAYKEALNRGYNEGQAKTYGVLVGSSEALLQYALGGISKLGGKLSNGIIKKMVSGIDDGFARFALEFGGSLASEGFEEGLQEVLTPFFENIAFNANNTMEDVDWSQVAYSTLLGSLSAFGLEGGGAAISSIVNNHAMNVAEGERIVNNDGLDDLAALANEVAGVGKTKLSKLASKTNSKRGVNTAAVGKLSFAVDKARVQQNKADITNALVEKGVPKAKAKNYANILIEMNREYYNGDESTSPFTFGTDKQWKKITGDENAYSVMRSVVADMDSSVNARNLQHQLGRQGLKMTEEGKVALADHNQQKVKEEVLKKSFGKQSEGIEAKVAEDGKAKVGDTEVTLKGVDHIETKKNDEGKNVKVAYLKAVDADGNESVVEWSDVEFGSRNDAVLYGTFVGMDIDHAYFDAFVKNFNEADYDASIGEAALQYAMGFRNSFRYGWANMETEMNEDMFASKLTESVRNTAYTLGKESIDSKIDAEQKSLDTAVEARKASGKGKARTQGELHMADTIKTKPKKSFTKAQNAGIGLAKRLTNIGYNVYLFESHKDENGNWVDENGNEADNGFYRAADGSIHIDINAGRGDVSLMAYTLSHELVHSMRQYSPREFKVLADLLYKWYGKKGLSINELVERKMDELDCDWDTAYEEVIADSCESFLTDSNIADRIVELQQTDKEAWEIIRDKVLDFLKWMKSLFVDVDPDSDEGRFVREYKDEIDHLYDAFYNALASASETMQWVGSIAEAKTNAETLATAGITVDADTGSAVMNSVRYAPKTQAEIDKVAKALSESMGVSIEKAKAWVKSETSLTSIILDPSNAMFLDYEADDRYEAIKKNAEYPQGTVDFSNLCKKRREFTALLDKLQKEHPNRIITAAEMEQIRQILIEEDVEVACGLCYVEERRQLLGEIAQGFIDGYKNGTLKEAIAKELDAKDNYVPTIYDLITYDGYRALTTEHPSIAKAFQKFNNARGMQAGRLIEGIAEYKRDILKWSQKKVDFVNSVGGLRVFSFSDFEATHLIDLVQVIQDCAAKGVMIQAYTKVPAFANAVKDTNMKVNRSLIAKGTGIKYENGRMVLDLDPVEGIDINDKDFFDSTDSKNVGNVLVGMSNEQIRLAMKTPFVDYIIPFHTGLKGDILKAKKIDHWDNYKNFQTDKEYHPEKVSYNKDGSIKSDGWVVAEKQINVYVDVIQAAEAEGKSIKNKVDFVNKFLAVAKEKGLKPRFWNFLDVDANGEYTYTEGYHKFLVDFKLFDQDGNILPQEPVVPEFDDALNARILNEYVEGKKAPVSRDAVYDRLENEVINGDVKKSSRKTGQSAKNPYNVNRANQEGDFVDEFHDLLTGREWHQFYDEIARRGLLSKLDIGTTAYILVGDKLIAAERQWIRDDSHDFLVQMIVSPTDNFNSLEAFEELVDLFKGGQQYDIERVGQVISEFSQQYDATGLFTVHSRTDLRTTSDGGSGKQTANRSGLGGVSRTGESRSPGKEVPLRDKPGVQESGRTQVKKSSRRVTAEQDAQYLELAKDPVKNEKKLRKMVQEVALDSGVIRTYTKKSGYKPQSYWHYSRTGGGFTSFNVPAWFSESRNYATNRLQPTIFGTEDLSKDSKEYYLTQPGNGLVVPNIYGRQVFKGSYFKNKYPFLDGVLDDDKFYGTNQLVEDETIRNVLIKNGISNVYANEDGYNVCIVLDSSQIKSADPVTYDDSGNVIPLSKRFDSSNDDIRYSKRKKAPTFYSYMGVVVDGVKQDKLGAASVINMLKGKGVKDEEIKWSGIEAWLEGKKSVTKAELQEFIAGSQLQIEEVTLDNKDRPYTEDQQKRLDEYETKRDEVAKRLADEWKKVTGDEFPIRNAGAGLESAVTNAIIDANLAKKKASFEGRLLEKLRKDLYEVIERNDDFGFDSAKDALRSIHRHRRDFIPHYEMSTNDKAVIVKYCNALNEYNNLPNSISDADTDKLRSIALEADPWNRKIMEVKHEHNEEEASYMTKWGQYSLKGGKNYREVLFRIPDSTYSNSAMFAHWGERRGVLAHARIQDFVDADGNKMLFIEELQSDWHNEGHKSGYRNLGAEDKYTVSKKMDKFREEFFESSVAKMFEEKVSAVGYEGAGVSMMLNYLLDETDYTLDVLRRKGASFTDSEMSEIDRYVREYGELQKQWEDAPGELTAPDAPFKETYHEFVLKRLIRMAAEEGYDSIGWTTANTQMGRWNPKRKTNREMGIEDAKNPDAIAFELAYRNLYDRNIRKHLEKFGENFGADVGKTYIHTKQLSMEEEMDNAFIDDMLTDAERERESGTYSVWTMPITDSMKDSVLYDGQVMYQRRGTGTSNRSLLANALESATQHESEARRLSEYKEKIDLINAEEKKLYETRQRIAELSFAKGPKDTVAIKNLQATATRIANRINTYDKQLLNLEATAPLKAVLEREKAMVKKREKQKSDEALAKYREKSAETLREVMNRNAESRKRSVESRHRTEMRHKIKRVVSELNQLLLNGTRDKHIKIDLQKATAEALSAINMDTVNAEKRLEEIQRKIDATNDPDKIAELQKTYDRIEQQGENMMNKLTALKNAYEEIKDSSGPLVANAYHPEIEERIKNLRKDVGDTPLREMSLEQLENVYDTYKMVLHTIRTANKAFKADKAESIEVLANRTMEEVHTVGGTKAKSLVLAKLFKKFFWNGLKPVYAFKAIGSSTLSKLFDNVRAGEDTWAVDVSEAKDYFKNVSEKYNYDSWDFDKQYTFRSKTGREFSLSIEQIMSLYAYSKRKQADKHLEKGGFVFDEAIEVKEKTKLGIPLKYEVNVATSHNLSRDILGEIVGTLSNEQKAFVDEMQAYLSDVMGAKGNEVSLEMFGVKLFKEKFYFPLKSAKQFMYEQDEVAGEVRLKNSGFSKETKEYANNPIILSNFMDVWANHVNDMSMYHAFVLQLEDFNRVFNYKTPSTDNLDTESLKMYIQNAYGSHANQYISQLLKDLNGGARTDPSADFITKGIGLFKKSAVFASASVVIQQPSAIARAFAMIDSKYFATKLSVTQHKDEWAEVKKYAPVAIIKEMGYFDTHMGRSTTDFIKAKEYDGVVEKMKGLVTDSGYRDEVVSKAPALADELSWCYIWNAVKKEVADTTDLKVGSEEFLKKCGERFTEVVVNTQVYDSVLSRSAMMRSKDTGMKMVTAFMAEPTTSINMIADAIIQGKRGNKKGASKTIGAVVASLILNSILVSFVYAGRDDDEDKTYAEKYIGTLTRELIDSFNPLTMIPFVKDIISISQGYDVERSDMAVISDLFTAFKKLSNDNLSAYEKVEDFGGAVAAIFGLPVKNIMRDVRAMYNTASSFINGQDTTGKGVQQAVKEAVTGNADTNSEQLYDAIVSGDEAHEERVKDRYKDDSTYKSAVKKALRENDPRIREALKIRVNDGITDKYLSIRQDIIDDGNIEQSIVNEALKAEYNYFIGKIEEAADLLKEGDKESSDDIIRDLKKKYKGTFTQDDILKAVKKRAGLLK